MLEAMKKRITVLADRREAVSHDMKNRLWIEMEERKPDMDKLIIVCLADGTVECATYNGLTWSYPHNNDHIFEDVVAWQPLPEPYVKQEIDE